MKTKQQFYLPGYDVKKISSLHGGQHSAGKRKSRRPISIKKSMHTVLRSSRAKGRKSLRTFSNFALANQLINFFADRFNIRIYRYSINSNHIHIVLRAKRRADFQNFLRALAGTLALKILDNAGELQSGRFWDLLAFSRIVEWGNGFEIVMNYVLQNQLESEGLVPYKPRRIRSMNSS